MPFEGFNFEPDGQSPAVIANSDAAAHTLGYSTVADVAIARLGVKIGGITVHEDVVEDGKFRSAIFVEAMMAYRGKGCFETTSIVVDAVFFLALRGYMGERICREAIESDGEKHGFVHALLALESAKLDEPITVEVEWKQILAT